MNNYHDLENNSDSVSTTVGNIVNQLVFHLTNLIQQSFRFSAKPRTLPHCSAVAVVV